MMYEGLVKMGPNTSIWRWCADRCSFLASALILETWPLYFIFPCYVLSLQFINLYVVMCLGQYFVLILFYYICRYARGCLEMVVMKRMAIAHILTLGQRVFICRLIVSRVGNFLFDTSYFYMNSFTKTPILGRLVLNFQSYYYYVISPYETYYFVV